MKAYSLLKPGGRLIAIAPAGLEFSTTKKIKALYDLVYKRGEIVDLPANSFKESGTGVNCVLVVMNKPGRIEAAFQPQPVAVPVVTVEPKPVSVPQPVAAKRYHEDRKVPSLKDEVDAIRMAWKSGSVKALDHSVYPPALRMKRVKTPKRLMRAKAAAALIALVVSESAIATTIETNAQIVKEAEASIAAICGPRPDPASYVDFNTPTHGDYYDLPFHLTGEIRGRLKKVRPMVAADLPGQMRMF